MRLRERIRMHGWRWPLSYLLGRSISPGSAYWMPSLWDDTECPQEALSHGFWQSTEAQRLEFRELGFIPCGFSKVTRHFDPNSLDLGGISFWDPSRSHMGTLAYVKVRPPPPFDRPIEATTIAFTAALENGKLTCTNDKGFDGLRLHSIVYLASASPRTIHQRFVRELGRYREKPRQFSDLSSLKKWSDEQQLALFEDRVNRGLFVPLTDAEVEVARGKMPPPLPGGPC
ncbi:MAG: hypothetical protein ACK4UN_13770 [Limisphaerales bacterium]